MKKSLLLFILPLIVFTYLSFIFFQSACDYTFSAKAEKKIPFTHKSHVTKYGADCSMCHGYEENGRFKGLPTVGDCTACHARDGATISNDPLEPKRKPFFDALKDSDKPWESFARQPDLVYFSHKVVMTTKLPNGKLKARCGSCHGDKENSMTTRRIKGKMLMGQCMDCHTTLKISNKCAVCHD